MPVQNLFTGLSGVPSVAIILFLVLGAVLAAQLWYLRPKRKLPSIPSLEETSPQPLSEAQEFKPLSQRQILIVGFLLVLLVITPVAVFVFKQTQEAKKITLVPSPTPTLTARPAPTKTPTPLPIPTFTPLPESATPSATPKELAKKLFTSPTPTLTPTPTPTKVGAVSPTPSPTELPKAEKPKELPGASDTQKTILWLIGGVLLLLTGLAL